MTSAFALVKTYASSFSTLWNGFPTVTRPEDDDASAHTSSGGRRGLDPSTVLLTPARRTGARLVLVPLLHPLKPKIALPAELWVKCLSFAMFDDRDERRKDLSPKEKLHLRRCKVDLVLVNKQFKEVASATLYSNIQVRTVWALEALHRVVIEGDRKWDNLRRIPHSTPGRWIQTLSVASISEDALTRGTRLHVDNLLSELLRLLPFLSTFLGDSRLTLSGRALEVLRQASGIRLRVLKGITASEDSASIPNSRYLMTRDPLIKLLKTSGNTLEVLEVFGPGQTMEPAMLNSIFASGELTSAMESLVFPRLHTLTLHGVPHSQLLHILLRGILPLPSLIRLTLTAYPSHDIYVPSYSALLLAKVAGTVQSLILATPPDWPPPDHTTFQPPPKHSAAYLGSSVLHILPGLQRLNLTFPLPPLLLIPVKTCDLRTLLFPRPIPALLPFVTDMAANDVQPNEILPQAAMQTTTSPPSPMMRARPMRRSSSSAGSKAAAAPPPPQQSPKLSATVVEGDCGPLRTVVWTKAKWIRSDVGSVSRGARTAGDQVEMLRWRRLLAGRVRLVDADGKEVI